MATLRESALEYTQQQTKNIAELPQVPVDLEVLNGSGIDENGKEYSYKYAEFNGEKYRIPNIVLGLLKDIIEESPNVKNVRIKKTGAGLQTRYSVIPLV